jgi:hypothetical protein
MVRRSVSNLEYICSTLSFVAGCFVFVLFVLYGIDSSAFRLWVYWNFEICLMRQEYFQENSDYKKR